MNFLQSELFFHDIVTLTNDILEFNDGTENTDTTTEFLTSGTSFDFNNKQDNLFIVGTEDGKIYEYSKEYKDRLTSFDGHYMPIYAIKWNAFYKRVFITCSADWTVKIWDHRYT